MLLCETLELELLMAVLPLLLSLSDDVTRFLCARGLSSFNISENTVAAEPTFGVAVMLLLLLMMLFTS